MSPQSAPDPTARADVHWPDEDFDDAGEIW
jgi:hypothetical protein